MAPVQVIKRDGSKQLYNPSKVMNAIHLAFQATGKDIDFTSLKQLTSKVETHLTNEEVKRDDIDEAVVKTLKEETMFVQANEYETYCNKRKQLKKILVSSKEVKDSTDLNLLIENDASTSLNSFDPSRITKNLEKQDLGLSKEQIAVISKHTEVEILELYDKSKDKDGKFILDTDTIRALIASTMAKMGFNPEQVLKAGNYGMPREDIEQLIHAKTKENANVGTNNPEAVALGIWETILKKYALNEVFSKDLKEAHLKGRMHIHDLGYITRVYCSGHSPAYLKKYGLILDNLDTQSSPAKHAMTLSGHISTFLASMQAYYAGALGLSYINLEFAPYVEGMSREHLNKIAEGVSEAIKDNVELKEQFDQMMKNYVDMKQTAQNLIFTQSQSAFSRGGQTLFIDFNLHAGVPSMLNDIPIICPGGTYRICNEDGSNREDLVRVKDKSSYDGLVFKDKDGNVLVDGKGSFNRKALKEQGKRFVTYKDYEKEAQDFLMALLDVYYAGDMNGKMFAFPKCDLHVDKTTFEDETQKKIVKRASEVAAKNSSAYFIFDRDTVTMAACCRLRTSLDPNVLEHPESIRFCGFQNITVNLPQAAYRAIEKGNKSVQGLVDEIYDVMDLAFKAHVQRRKFVETLMKPGCPLYQVGKPALDGKPYVDLDKATYIIGMLGLNEAIKVIHGEELHESKLALQLGEEVMAAMYQRKNEYVRQTGWKFSIEESPAESAARNLAKRDMGHSIFGKYATEVHQGTTNDPYYTNSVHYRADAPNVSGIDRIIDLSKFHPVIESGAIIHLFTGESDLNPDAIFETVKATMEKTQCSQITVSGEHTSCMDCGTQMKGFFESCEKCCGSNVTHTEKVVGYNSTVENWNQSKVEESKARQRGNYEMDVNLIDQEDEFQVNEKTPIRAVVYGRKLCSSCDELKANLNEFLQKPEYKGKVEYEFVDMGADGPEGRAGLVKAMSDRMNLSEIPGLAFEFNTDDGIVRPLEEVPILTTGSYLERYEATDSLMSVDIPITKDMIKESLDKALKVAER